MILNSIEDSLNRISSFNTIENLNQYLSHCNTEILVVNFSSITSGFRFLPLISGDTEIEDNLLFYQSMSDENIRNLTMEYSPNHRSYSDLLNSIPSVGNMRSFNFTFTYKGEQIDLYYRKNFAFTFIDDKFEILFSINPTLYAGSFNEVHEIHTSNTLLVFSAFNNKMYSRMRNEIIKYLEPKFNIINIHSLNIITKEDAKSITFNYKEIIRENLNELQTWLGIAEH